MSSRSLSTIDLSTLPPEVAERLVWELEWAKKDHALKSRWRQICDHAPDDEIIRAGQKESGCEGVVLASSYGPGGVRNWQEIVAWAVLYHPRRPVLMRGGVRGCIASHSRSRPDCANGWCESVFRRAVRMSKLTALSYEELEPFQEALVSRITERYSSLTYHFFDKVKILFLGKSPFRRDDAIAYVGGKLRYLTDAQFEYIARLREIADKFDSVEKRKDALRNYTIERLAA